MFGYKRPENEIPSPDYITRDELSKELSAMKQLFLEQEKLIRELAHRFESYNPESLAENEEDIDAILLKEPSPTKTVVTGT